MAGTVDRPVPWPGTAEEAEANYWTHRWMTYDEERECDSCLSKPWHKSASYPCGAIVPRETVTWGHLMASQRKFRETSEMAAMASRVIKAIGRRVGEEDASSLVYLMTVQAALDNAWKHAVDGIRETGSPDKDIADVLGVTRQAVQQRWPWPESAA